MNKIKTYEEFNEEVNWANAVTGAATVGVLGLGGAAIYQSIANNNLATNDDKVIVSGQEFNSYTLYSDEDFDLSVCKDDGFIVSRHSYKVGKNTHSVTTLNVPKGYDDVYYDNPFFGSVKASSKKFAGSKHIKISDLDVVESTKDYTIYSGSWFSTFDYIVVDNGGYNKDGVEFKFNDSSLGSWKYYEIDSHVYLFKPYALGGGSFSGGGAGESY